MNNINNTLSNNINYNLKKIINNNKILNSILFTPNDKELKINSDNTNNPIINLLKNNIEILRSMKNNNMLNIKFDNEKVIFVFFIYIENINSSVVLNLYEIDFFYIKKINKEDFVCKDIFEIYKEPYNNIELFKNNLSIDNKLSKIIEMYELYLIK